MKAARKIFWLTLFLGAISLETFSQGLPTNQQQVQQLGDHVFDLSEVMLHDVANPPAASRVYAYALLGAYQAALYANSKLPDISRKLKIDPQFERVTPPKKMNLSLCTNYALLEVGRQLMPSGYLLDEKKKALVDQVRKSEKLSEREAAQQVKYAMAVAGQVLDYAR